MKPIDPFLDEIVTRASQVLGVEPEVVRPLVKVPPDPARGDYALGCFSLAATLGGKPPQIAARAAASLSPGGILGRTQAVGPYWNFFLDPAVVTRRILQAVRSEEDRYGDGDEGAGQTVVIDFSSPNIAKHLAFHHIRSTMIGCSLGHILRFRGYRVVGVNHLGDWGTNFGQLLVAFERYGLTEKELETGGITRLNEIYVRFNAEMKEAPELEEQARQAFARLEAGEPRAQALWQLFCDTSLREFEQVYRLLGVEFEAHTGESFYIPQQDAVIRELEAKGLTSVSEGALVVDLSDDGISVPCMLRKSDGTSLYATRDIAAALYRQRTFKFDHCLYVVDMGQSLHFRQWFRVVEKMGYSWARGLEHVPFGIVVLRQVDAEGKTYWCRGRTREGGVILLRDVLDEAIQRTREVIARSPTTELSSPEEVEETARAIGVGAVIFNTLKSARVKDVKFDWDEVVALDGFTAAYIQCAHARLAGILRKAPIPPPEEADLALLDHPAEQALVRHMRVFPGVTARAAREREPSVIAAFLYELARDLSRFYHDCRVITDDPQARPLMEARLVLVDALRIVTATGLRLLGLQAPERA